VMHQGQSMTLPTGGLGCPMLFGIFAGLFPCVWHAVRVLSKCRMHCFVFEPTIQLRSIQLIQLRMHSFSALSCHMTWCSVHTQAKAESV
jgi:hypothetical protein